ncbi:MAG: ECF-type sigma factor [Polyangiales bacterium]
MDGSLTAMIVAADGGDAAATKHLFSVLYAELRAIARREVQRCAGKHMSLGVTSLLHQAYMVMGARSAADFPDRARFMSYAARAMRSVIIDHARARRAQKRGGGFELTTADPDEMAGGGPDHVRLERLSATLDQLAEVDLSLAEVVDLKFFAGFSFDEIAALRGVSSRTVMRHWNQARIFLHTQMKEHALD